MSPSRVAVVSRPGIRYGETAPFGPPSPVYEAVEALFLALGLDQARAGTPDWNPLGDLIEKVPAGGDWIIADELGIDFLGEIPIEPAVREGADRGVPVVYGAPDSESAKAIERIAKNVAARTVGSATASRPKPSRPCPAPSLM